MDLSHNKIDMYVIYVYILRTHICKYIVHGLKKTCIIDTTEYKT